MGSNGPESLRYLTAYSHSSAYYNINGLSEHSHGERLPRENDGAYLRTNILDVFFAISLIAAFGACVT